MTMLDNHSPTPARQRWRSAVKSIVFAALATGLTACGNADGSPGTRRGVERRLTAAFNALAAEELARAPETARRVGAGSDRGSDRITDRSQAAFERARLSRIEALERIAALPEPPAQTRLASALETVRTAYADAVDLARFGHGRVSLSSARPYALDHMSGAYIELAEHLTNDDAATDLESARAFLDRLSAAAEAIDDERRRLVIDAEAGVSPPDFVLRRVAEAAIGFADGPPASHPFVLAATRQAAATDLAETEQLQFRTDAAQIVETAIVPAYLRLAEAASALAIGASSEPGVWTSPQGEAYYDAALRFHGGRNASAAALHAEALELVAALTAEADAALMEVGRTDGDVGARLSALAAEPDQTYEDSEEGRATLLADLAAAAGRIEGSLPAVFARSPEHPIAIAPAPRLAEAYAPGGLYRATEVNGVPSGVFLINLQDPSNWPAFALPSLAYHETAPGHHTASAIAAEHGRVPPLLRLIWRPAFSEGWAVYAETLADEIGAYADDPIGRIGYLQSLLFRAARVVADTGIHHKRWSREAAIAYLTETTGLPAAMMADEVDRCAVWPGQAAGYVTGWQTIRTLRARAEGVLGPSFDLAAFHHLVLARGSRPLHVLEADVSAWLSAQLPDGG